MKYIISMLIAINVGSIISVPIEPELELEPDPIINVDRDIHIDLYTLKNQNEPQLLVVHDKNSIAQSNYNRKVPTRIFIHGFGNGRAFTNSFADAYLGKAQHDVNLIAINWSKISSTLNYISARRSVRVVGQRTAEFIDFMVTNKMLTLSSLTVIGFSLGAHVAGFAGKHIQSGRLPKIIGLDPAGILFDINKPDERLNSTDAIYVETIQTSLLGFVSPIGSVSFFPNGRTNQPGCTWQGGISCSHSTSYNYFLQTIYMNIPYYGDYCNSIDDIKRGKCDANKQASMGGEPGAKIQSPGMYYIRMNPELTVEFDDFGEMIDLQEVETNS